MVAQVTETDLALAAVRLSKLREADAWGRTRRPAQAPPAGAWRTWLVMSGRGWGKTRVGAEWVRELVQRGEASRIALVGPTAADVRDVMIEGESGLLACCERYGIHATYQPSKRRVVFRTGAIATTFSAEEPDRLRGPQHDAAWCLVGETLVTMADLSVKQLKDVVIGDEVLTTAGARSVIGSALTRQNAELWRVSTVAGRGILGTADHPVWVEGKGFVPISNLKKGDKLWAVRPSSSTGTSSILTGVATTQHGSGCTAQSGSRSTGRSHQDSTFITSTVSSQTIASRTSSSFLTPSTPPSTWRKRLGRIGNKRQSVRLHHNAGCVSSVWSAIWSALFAEAFSTVDRLIRLVSAPVNVLRVLDHNGLNQNVVFASSAGMNTTLPGELNAIAQEHVTTERLHSEQRVWRSVNWHARLVECSSLASDQTLDSAAEIVQFDTTDEILFVERSPSTADVFDIAVEGAHEFFANGILVHNCDEVAAWRYPATYDNLQMGLRLGSYPRQVITTTPKPVTLVKQLVAQERTSDGEIVITRGSTFDNAANLAPSFLETITDRYQGTRLGRQELEGELLEDVEGALWSIAMLDACRVREAPELARIVVAVDPATTHGEESDATGIAVAGRARDGQVYVLHAEGVRLSPAGWANRVADLVERFGADAVVAETNQGGEMVSSTLRSVNPRLRVVTVHATRGKTLRAEPVVALYEQGKAHHVGVLAALEEQMTAFPVAAEHDDIVDATVHALTELSAPYRPKHIRGVS